MGAVLLYQNLNFSTRFSCDNVAVEDFVTLYMGKNMVDEEMFYLGMVSTNLCKLFHAGEIQNSNCRRLEMATYFSSPGGWSNMSPVGAIFVPFPFKTGKKLLHPLPPSIVERVMCKSRQSCSSTIPLPVKHRHQQRTWRFYPRHCRWMNTSTAPQECAPLIIFVHYVQNFEQAPHRCCYGLLAAIFPRILNSLHWR